MDKPGDYNKTVNLPKTDFPMRASLPKREPDMIKEIYDLDLYHEMLKKNEGRPIFNLHDGPPFSNGAIHMGTALNKCIKDFITRYKSMAGYNAIYYPGWDNHGMPIESAIIKEQKLNHKEMSTAEFRDACHAFAQHYVDVQREQFIRLGVLGEWDDYYRTMDPKFEAEEIKVFGKMFEKGYIYKGKKPVYWCPHDETALAEAEIEYSEEPCSSVYVKFKIKDDKGKLGRYCDLNNTYFLIWTTTVWTLPGNLAICLGPDFDYVLARTPSGETYILAKNLVEEVFKTAGIENVEILCELKGSEFEFMNALHPMYDRESLIILGDHVTLEAGTGCVHTAPGHGHEDFDICHEYDTKKNTNIGLILPVDGRGRMNELSGKYEGLTTDEANIAIVKDLKEDGALFAEQDIIHQYAHCWRCKTPILYRATDQWFCSVDSFKDEACASCDDVEWIPEWGHDRMIAMIRERSDWCISRQRRWGLPIPVFYCESCHEPVCTEETIESVSNIFREKGSNAWFELPAAELLPQGFACPHCGGKTFTKESDTLDGWFDSGSSHTGSMKLDAPGRFPAEMYLEGGDQFRGWFQSALLTSVAVYGVAPYKAVLCHGWTVDGEGKAMHKSLGNGILPEEVIPKYGADIIRLWAGSADYRLDVRCSDNIFKQLSDKYLKIRNTARFILGNMEGFDPNSPTAYEDMPELDRWALGRLSRLVDRCIGAYDKYEFFSVSYAIHNFCVVEMSNFYLDIIKDRLYCDAPDSLSRRSAQTTMFTILDAIVRLLAPILAFTANEIWTAMPHRQSDDPRHVMLNDMPKAENIPTLTEAEAGRWERLLALRDDVNKAIELSRGEKTIGKSLDAKLELSFGESEAEARAVIGETDLEQLFIVSEVSVTAEQTEGVGGESFPGLKIKVEASELSRCPRCWIRDGAIGSDAEYPELCPRCARVLKDI